MENGINKISAYGDSILKGAVTGTGSGHLFDIIEDSSLVLASKSMGFELNNNSVFGSVVSKTQRRLNRDLEKGIECDLAIIESGGNDCDYDWAFVSGTDPKDFGTLAPRTTLAEFIISTVPCLYSPSSCQDIQLCQPHALSLIVI